MVTAVEAGSRYGEAPDEAGTAFLLGEEPPDAGSEAAPAPDEPGRPDAAGQSDEGASSRGLFLAIAGAAVLLGLVAAFVAWRRRSTASRG